MNNDLAKSILNICKILNKNAVEYLIVGGTAVALHGYFRLSTTISGQTAEKLDFDLWYNSTYDNYFKLLNALNELGQDVSEFKSEKYPNPKKSYFKCEFDHFTLDLLPELKGLVKFHTAYKTKEIVIIQKTEIPFLCYDDLIKTKQINARPKDLLDIEQLKKLRNKNGKPS
jgi:hypothetical protein